MDGWRWPEEVEDGGRPAHPLHSLSGLLFVATLVLLHHLDHFSLARSLPATTAGPGMFQCLNHSQNLLRAVSNTLEKARQTLEFYSCTSEEIDHEDITKDRTSTVEACLPLELATNESCLASRETSLITNGSCLASRRSSLMTTLCLSSIYEDLRMYHMEFQAMNAKLLMDHKRQIFVDQNMLAAVAELMQALNSHSKIVSQKPSLEELDFYKTKVKLCILLHAFRIRVVTIDRMMSYLSSS
ncbi:interleukin-12 subunit alpha isoform X1 [Phocoena sinus]|uniref:Interleukin-12 subunit alpha n=1 Tax=Phocoena sinus TaxID=42100 RepID=A0A8C9DWV2_PHOSS|nr:interleukin-12 subunit alpha isoform X1 [Phocoena sinus]